MEKIHHDQKYLFEVLRDSFNWAVLRQNCRARKQVSVCQDEAGECLIIVESEFEGVHVDELFCVLIVVVNARLLAFVNRTIHQESEFYCM